MTKRILVCGILALAAGMFLAAQSKPSEAQADKVKVYSQQGYYVHAKNSNDYACYYSFNYTVTGYDGDGKEVFKKEETSKDRVLEAKEDRELFTAPVDNANKISYWITITQVFGVRKIG